MTEQARRCIAFVLAREGGYVNHPSDPGGETNFGISKRAYPKLDIASLTREQAETIYEADYYQKIHGDRLPEPVAMALLDFAVHSGVKTAWRYFVNVLGIPVQAKLDEVLEAMRHAPEPRIVALQLIIERALFLVRRALAVPGQDVFAKGWVARMVELKHAVEAA